MYHTTGMSHLKVLKEVNFMLVDFQKRYYVPKHAKCLMPIKSTFCLSRCGKSYSTMSPGLVLGLFLLCLFDFTPHCQVTTLLNFRSLIFCVTPFRLFIWNFVLFYVQTPRWHNQWRNKTSVVKGWDSECRHLWQRR